MFRLCCVEVGILETILQTCSPHQLLFLWPLRLPNVQSLAPINLPSATFTTCLTIGGTSQEPAERARFNPSYKSVLRSLSVHLSGVQVCCDAHHQLRMGNPRTPATICRSEGVVFFKTVEFRPFASWELFRVSSMQRSDVSLVAEAEAVAEFSRPSSQSVRYDMSGKLDALFQCRQ